MVELERQLCPRRRARPQVGRSVGRRRGRLSETQRRRLNARARGSGLASRAAPVILTRTIPMRRAIAKEQGRPDAWCAGVPPREQSRRAAAEWLLSLAAAPTFAVMAAFTASRGDMPDMLCSMAVNSSPLTGMWLMYLL